jgi:hypothetical protein
VLDVDHGKVFDYLSDIERLPAWATEFARQLRREGDDYKVVNGLGEFSFAIEADRRTGVICGPRVVRRLKGVGILGGHGRRRPRAPTCEASPHAAGGGRASQRRISCVT